jgi:hypothetical protein
VLWSSQAGWLLAVRHWRPVVAARCSGVSAGHTDGSLNKCLLALTWP